MATVRLQNVRSLCILCYFVWATTAVPNNTELSVTSAALMPRVKCAETTLYKVCGVKFFFANYRSIYGEQISHTVVKSISPESSPLCQCSYRQSVSRISGDCWKGNDVWRDNQRTILHCLDAITFTGTTSNNTAAEPAIIPWRDISASLTNLPEFEIPELRVVNLTMKCDQCENAWLPYMVDLLKTTGEGAKMILRKMKLPNDIKITYNEHRKCSFNDFAQHCNKSIVAIRAVYNHSTASITCEIDGDSDICLFGAVRRVLEPSPAVIDDGGSCKQKLTFALPKAQTMAESSFAVCWTQGMVPAASMVTHYTPGKPMFIDWITRRTDGSQGLQAIGYIVSYPTIYNDEIQWWYHKPLNEEIVNRSLYRIAPDSWHSDKGKTGGVKTHVKFHEPFHLHKWTAVRCILHIADVVLCGTKGTYILHVCNPYGCVSKFIHVEEVPFASCGDVHETFNVIDEQPMTNRTLGVDDSGNPGKIPIVILPSGPLDKPPLKPIQPINSKSSTSGDAQDDEWTFKDWIYLMAVPSMLTVLMVVLLVVSIIAFYLWRIKRRHRHTIAKEYVDMEPMLVENPGYYDLLNSIRQKNIPIVPCEEIEVIMELGAGAFGTVYLVRRNSPTEGEETVLPPGGQSEHANYISLTNDVSTPATDTTFLGSEAGTTPPTPVPPRRCTDRRLMAMKQLKSLSEEKLKDFEYEAELLATLHHRNIVTFHGLTLKDGGFALLFEYMDDNNLITFLRKYNPELQQIRTRLSYAQLLRISVQVASGLEYLASRRLVHRDLAARNCLVADNGRVVKLSDFGMSRDIYITDYYLMESHTMVPLRWLPPETIIYRKFTLESDVWSFGVVLWEIFSHGQVPWFIYSNTEVFEIVKSGRILDRPVDCPKEVYDQVMLGCFDLAPDARTPIGRLRQQLQSLLEATLNYCEILSESAANAAVLGAELVADDDTDPDTDAVISNAAANVVVSQQRRLSALS